MLTAASADNDSDVLWLRQQAAWLRTTETNTVKLADAATAINAYITSATPNDTAGLGYAVNIQKASDALYPSAQFPIRADIMATVASDLSSLLQGKPISNLTYDTQWLSQQAVFYSALLPTINMLTPVVTALAQPAYSIFSGYKVEIAAANNSLIQLYQQGSAPTYFDAISERMLALAAPAPAPVTPPPPVTGGSGTVKSSGGGTTAAASNSTLYIALAAAAASVGGWWYLRTKHLKGARR
jgi:hypothetical protein